MSYSRARYRQIDSAAYRAAQERRLQESLRGRCFVLEEECARLCAELGESYSEKDKHGMGTAELQAYLAQLQNDKRRLAEKVERKKWSDRCDTAAARILGLANYLETDDIYTKKLGTESTEELKSIHAGYEDAIRKLEKEKEVKLRGEVEKKIGQAVAAFGIEATKRLGSGSGSEPIRHSFSLERYKELVRAKLDGIRDTAFVAEYTERLVAVESQPQYLEWLSAVKTKGKQERLASAYMERQAGLMGMLLRLPDGQNRHTLEIEIQKLCDPRHWGDEPESWEGWLAGRHAALSGFLEKEVAENSKYVYMLDCLDEALADCGIAVGSGVRIDSGVASFVARLDGHEDYGLAILIDQDTGEIRYESAAMPGRAGSPEKLAAFEKDMCPSIHAVTDRLGEISGITSAFAEQAPPTTAAETDGKGKSAKAIAIDTQELQRSHIERQRLRLQQLQAAMQPQAR